MQMHLAVVMTAVLISSVASANLLVNPGVETGDFTGWTRFTEGQNWRVTDWPADIHSGSYGLVNDVLSSGGDEWRGIYQLVAVSAGQGYDFTAYMRAAMVESSESFLELQWLDSSGGLIEQWQSTHITADQDWTLTGSYGLVAPLASVTASVRIIVHMSAAPSDTDWHVADDVHFAQTIPEPSSAMLVGGGLLAAVGCAWRRRTRASVG